MRTTTVFPFLVATTTAFAGDLAVLHDNGMPDGENGYSNATGGVFGSRRTLLDDFVVPEHETWHVEAFRWWRMLGTPMGTGSVWGLRMVLRADESGAPGPVITEELELTDFWAVFTGRILFSREEEETWARFEPIALPPGHYWFEANVVAAENDFWLTASPIRHSECWVNYDDLGGFQSGSEQFGVASDLAWRLEGTREVSGVGACCLIDGQCFEMSFDACNENGGIYQGTNVNCFPNLCGAPHACCFQDGTCQYVTEQFCDSLGGYYIGGGMSCEEFQCIGTGLCLRPEASYVGRTGVVEVADLDGVNGVDLVVRGNHDELMVRLNDGTGAFESGVGYDTDDNAVALAIVDLDGDTDLDVAAAGPFDRVVSIHLNDGTGAIPHAAAYPAGLEPCDVAAGDLDGDLDHDLVVVDCEGDRVLVMMNDGAGAFAPFVEYPTDGPSSAAIGDIDGDLDLDLAVTNRVAGTVSVLLNDGSGLFGAPVVYDTVDDPADVIAHDLDGDGAVDLGIVGTSSDRLSVLLNDGSGVFSDEDYDAGNGPTQIAVMGTPGDGTPDLALTNRFDIAVLVNNGIGEFTRPSLHPHSREVSRIAAGDLDRDGDIDVVFTGTSFFTDRIRTLFNDCLECPADLDNSGAVDFGDILVILGAWGQSGGPEDLDGSGVVDFGDLLVVLGAWGVCG